MEQNETRQKNPEEMDLTQFFRWLRQGVEQFGNSILYGLASLRNIFFSNKLFFFTIIAVGLALGFIYSTLLKKDYYKTTMVLNCDYFNNQIVQNTVNKLNLLSSEPSGEGLSDHLGIDINTSKNILRFEAKPFISENDVVEMEVLREQLNNVAADKKELVDKVIKKLKVDNKRAYEISAYVYNPAIVKSLEKALINYFSNNEYIKHRLESNDRNLQSRKRKLVSESKKLDSLKTLMFSNYQMLAKSSSRGSNNVILNDERLLNPLDVFKEDLLINEQVLDIERQLYIQPDFEVIEGFTTFKQPQSKSLPETLVIAILISWVMGYVIIGIWRFDKYLKHFSINKINA